MKAHPSTCLHREFFHSILVQITFRLAFCQCSLMRTRTDNCVQYSQLFNCRTEILCTLMIREVIPFDILLRECVSPDILTECPNSTMIHHWQNNYRHCCWFITQLLQLNYLTSSKLMKIKGRQINSP